MTVVHFKPRRYEAKLFEAPTAFGKFLAAGTLCGHIDFVPPSGGTYPLTPEEALAIILLLQRALRDVAQK